ncbi:MAG: YtxH domain-containing protein [Thermomicrobiales bacterium]|nr:YtxH domain-containing protein [Thermomicrobiales bacterium]
MDGIHHGSRTVPWESLREIDWDNQLRDTSGDTSSLSFVSGMLLGTAIGLLAGFILAPRTGKQTIDQLRQSRSDVRSRIRQTRDEHEETLAEQGEEAETEMMRRIHRQE